MPQDKKKKHVTGHLDPKTKKGETRLARMFREHDVTEAKKKVKRKKRITTFMDRLKIELKKSK